MVSGSGPHTLGDMAKKSLGALDRSFLALEDRDVMMHVGGLVELAPPPGGAANLARELRDELRRDPPVRAPWNLRLEHPDLLKSPVQSWVTDDAPDVEYHVRRSALASPGDERELGILVSRLHGTPLDLHRPPWEAHFIEGLAGGRLAMYFKVHHALVDGYTAMRLLVRSLSTEPNVETPLFFTLPERDGGRREPRDTEATSLDALFHAAREQLGVTKDVGRALMGAMRARKTTPELALPMQAPRSILNRRISRSRRFATAQVKLERVKKLAASSGGTVNDVVLAICGAALRRFLLELGELPTKPLIAMVPVNIRPKDDPGGGNAVGAILASLATDVESPRAALDAVIASTSRAKAQLQGMSKAAIFQYSALVLAPMLLSFVPGAAGRVRPAFNVVVSNVPGPDHPLYFRGSKVEEVYPLSIPFHGYGLNVTVESYDGSLNFGFTGCRDTVPRLQKLAVHAIDVVDTLVAGARR